MCVASNFHLGFLLYGPLHKFGLAFYQPTDMDSSGPFKEGPSKHIFTLISCPLHPMGPSSFSGWTRGVTIQDFGGWRFKGKWVDSLNTNAINCANSWQVVHKPLWYMARVVFWLDFTSNRSVASTFVHSLYKYRCLYFSFLYF